MFPPQSRVNVAPRDPPSHRVLPDYSRTHDGTFARGLIAFPEWGSDVLGDLLADLQRGVGPAHVIGLNLAFLDNAGYR